MLSVRKSFLFTLNFVGASSVLLGADLAVASVTWEEQAERLQHVSATLLDGVPFGEPVQRSFSLELRASVSFLPRVNSRVGSKQEKVPASPIHSVPTLQANAAVKGGLLGATGTGLQTWAGYLPAGAEKLLGVNAKLTQWCVGAALQQSWRLSSVSLFLSGGAQLSDAQLRGAITEESANDSFQARTELAFFAPGLVHVSSGFWMNVLLGGKQTESVFEIPSDGTRFSLTDTLSDASPPLFVQPGAGWLFKSGIQLGGAVIWVPERLIMPRMLLSGQVAL